MLKVVRRDGQVCRVCQKNVPDHEIEFDHIIPHSLGGPTHAENLRLLCRSLQPKEEGLFERDPGGESRVKRSNKCVQRIAGKARSR